MPEPIHPFPVCRKPGCRSVPRPGYADRGLCGPCERDGLDALEALPTDHRDLLPLIWEKQSGALSAIGSPFGPTEPINLAVDALVREIRYATEQWEEIVRDRAGLSLPRGNSVTTACRLLAEFFSALLAVPGWDVVGYDRMVTVMDGPGAIVWLTDLHRRSRSRIGIVEKVFDLPGACPDCGWPSMRHRDTRATVWCEHCDQAWTWDDWQDMQARVVFGVAA